MAWAFGVGMVLLIALLSRGARAAPARRPPGFVIEPIRATRGRLTFSGDRREFAAQAEALLARARAGTAGAEELASAVEAARHHGMPQVADALALRLEALSLTRAPAALRARIARALGPVPPSTEALDALAAELDATYPLTARAVRARALTGPS